MSENSAGAILGGARELLEALVVANGVDEQDVASVFFTVTPDLDAAYPAVAAREMGWTHTALINVQEMVVPGSLPHCIRVLIHWNTERPATEIQHVYLREARSLRPDLAGHGHMSAS